jgi:hypothetical protein
VETLLLYTHDVALTREEIGRAGGRIIHELTPSVIVASVPSHARLQTCTTVRPGELDPTSVRAADAWLATRLATRSRSSEEASLSWDAPGYEPPD